MYTPVVFKERTHKPVSTARTIHISFHDQAVCGRGIKIKKGLVYVVDIAMWL